MRILVLNYEYPPLGGGAAVALAALAHRLLAPLTRWIWRRADRVVAVCESLGQLALDTWPDLRYAVVPNGVDLTLFHPADPATRRPSKRIRCLAVARLIERKGVGDLLRS